MAQRQHTCSFGEVFGGVPGGGPLVSKNSYQGEDSLSGNAEDYSRPFHKALMKR